MDNERNLKNLIYQLGSLNYDEQQQVIAALSMRKAVAVPLLIEALKEGNNQTRNNAAYLLKRVGDSNSVELLICLLREHPIGEVRLHAALILGVLGDKRAVEPLIESLQHDEDESVRHCAACALGELRDQRVIEPLLQALHDSYWEVRSNAALYLGGFDDKRAVEPLIRLLSDKEDEVRAFAAHSLGHLGDERALPALEWMAEYDTGVTQDGPVKYDAARAIEEIRQRSSLHP